MDFLPNARVIVQNIDLSYTYLIKPTKEPIYKTTKRPTEKPTKTPTKEPTVKPTKNIYYPSIGR